MVFNADKRKKLLDAHNKLRNMLQYADDCRTLEMRHLDDRVIQLGLFGEEIFA